MPALAPDSNSFIYRGSTYVLMWFESLWDVDQADRLFLLATTRHSLLTIAEQRLWKLLSEAWRETDS